MDHVPYDTKELVNTQVSTAVEHSSVVVSVLLFSNIFFPGCGPFAIFTASICYRVYRIATLESRIPQENKPGEDIKNPMDQFDLDCLDHSAVVTTLYITLLLLIFCVVIFGLLKCYKYTHTSVTGVTVDVLSGLVEKLSTDNLAMRRQYFFFSIFFTFLMILASNVAGLGAYAYTASSSLVYAFHFSHAHFVNINIVTIYNLD